MSREAFDFAMGSGAIVGSALLWAAVLIPTVRILRRMGFSGWWSPLALTGLGLVNGVWIIAFVGWPAVKPSDRPHTP